MMKFRILLLAVAAVFLASLPMQAQTAVFSVTPVTNGSTIQVCPARILTAKERG